MSNPHIKTTVLIIGAGPSGLAAALSLTKNGVSDLIIVDAIASRAPASRAMTVYAATLEALDTVSCAKPLIERGIKAKGLIWHARTGPFMEPDMPSLAAHTPYPFVLFLSQKTTEEVLEACLNKMGVTVLRPERAVGLQPVDGGLEVSFESGRCITARYVVGADGCKSAIRQLAGIAFLNPDGDNPDEHPTQMLIADVTFSSQSHLLPRDHGIGISSKDGLCAIMPLLPDESSTEEVYRLGVDVPFSAGRLRFDPSAEILQEFLNKSGPPHLSSDPAINPRPIYISRVIWSSSFRIRSALADKFIVRLGGCADGKGGGVVLLVGDAAHIHSPAGGQGMNLGIRDAIALGPVLAAHIAATPNTMDYCEQRLETYAHARRERAMHTIQFSKWLLSILTLAGCKSLIDTLFFFFVKMIGKIPFVRRRMAWNLSGLGNR